MKPIRPSRSVYSTLALLPLLALAAPAAAQFPTSAQTPNSVFIEELTWTEIRTAIDGGKTTVIVPIGGTEQNGPHMVMGKHNYIITHAADAMARRLGNALVAPTLQYVPEGDYTNPRFSEKPGVISLPSPDYDMVLDAAARSLQVHGFNEILFIGDSGGNQGGMTAVAEALNVEWEGTGNRAFALTDFYRMGADNYRAWMEAEFGYDQATVGSHAGISDTSQMLYVFPEGIRLYKRAPGGGSPDAGVTGDPTKATAEIGGMGIEFKVNAGIAQYRAIKDPPRRR